MPLLAIDCLLVLACYITVLLLVFDGPVPAAFWRGFAVFLPVAAASHLAANAGVQLYGQVWSQAGVEVARRLLVSAGASIAAICTFVIAFSPTVPRSVLVLAPILSTMAFGTVRFHVRLLDMPRRRGRRAHGRRARCRVAVIGAGSAGAAIVRQLHDADGMEPVAVFDDDPRRHGRSLLGVPILGDVESIPSLLAGLDVDEVVLAIAVADRELVARVASVVNRAGAHLKVVPPISDLVRGQVSIRDLREVKIEDLLGRRQVRTDLGAVKSVLGGKNVLVTGAGGSIGAEIVRQVAAMGPARLVLLDHDESRLHDVAAAIQPTPEVVLADIRDRDLIIGLFERHRPHVVFHAAAHKHVPMLEAHACEAAATNVFGTANAVDAARLAGVERFVLISTDKAVNPTSVMGASKWLAEQVVLQRAPADLHYCIVRFGNVLGSRGSVIPLFKRQIADGGPVTITDKRMTRFFMSIDEAVQLVLQSSALADGGEVFMLDMGDPVSILELAERMIFLSGRKVGTDIQISVIGARPGEKLQEELQAPGEETSPTAHPAISRLRPLKLVPETIDHALEQLRAALGSRSNEETAALLRALPDRLTEARGQVSHGQVSHGQVAQTASAEDGGGPSPSGDRQGEEPAADHRAAAASLVRLGRDGAADLAVLGAAPAFPGGVPFVRPAVPDLDRVVDRLRPSYERGLLTNGPLVRLLEEEAADQLGVRHVVAVSSCTSGLILVLQAIAVDGPVVLPSFTFSASAHAVAWNGREPRFAECDPATFQLDVSSAVDLADGAGAIMATHVFGAPCDIDQIEEAGRAAGIPVLFDAAHAFGARYRGRPVGGSGFAEIFSLSPTKVAVAGEGGLVATNHDYVAETVRLGRDYGNPGDYDTRFAGLNARMSELHAALAIESMRDCDENLALRRAAAERYAAGLAHVPGVLAQLVPPDDLSTFKDFTVRIDPDEFGMSRDDLALALRWEGVDTRPYFYPPVHRQQAYRHLPGGPLPVTDVVATQVLSLPIYPGLAHTTVERILELIGNLHIHSSEVRRSLHVRQRAS